MFEFLKDKRERDLFFKKIDDFNRLVAEQLVDIIIRFFEITEGIFGIIILIPIIIWLVVKYCTYELIIRLIKKWIEED